MNNQPNPDFFELPRIATILGGFVIVAVLTLALHHYLRPPPLGRDRVATRLKALDDMRGTEEEGLNTPVWLDRGKGIVRLPIADAIRLTLREWSRDPAAARSNLIARVETATAPPPKAKEKPSPFE